MERNTEPRTKISILFVEDDEVILKVQTIILTSNYPDTVFYTAVNGRLGLELFKTHLPEIVITDINMPVMCGVQMSDHIRSIRPGTKFIAISGKTGETAVNGKVILRNPDGTAMEFDHAIVKPVVFSDLFAVVDRCIGEIAQREVIQGDAENSKGHFSE
jgi:CheY-like chemotaxis protein